jgi:hypothetical protein
MILHPQRLVDGVLRLDARQLAQYHFSRAGQLVPPAEDCSSPRILSLGSLRLCRSSNYELDCEQGTMKDDSENAVQAQGRLTNEEMLGWIEFGCWTMLLLTPALCHINGPAVSPDQLVVRTALVLIAGIVAASLRFRHRRLRQRCCAQGRAPHRPR